MKKTIIPLFAIATLAVLLFQCKSEYLEPTENICFKTQIQPLITSSCTQSKCHNAIDKEKGFDYSTYEGIMESVKAGDYQGSELYQVLVLPFGDKVMPKSPYARLSRAQIKTIAEWIAQGATNDSACGNSVDCDLTNVTYSGTIKPILDNYCNGCHTGSDPSAGTDYTLHAGVQEDALDGSLVKSIEGTDGFTLMPYQSDIMPDCEIAKIKQWVADGALNN